MTIFEILGEAERILQENGVPEARREASSLLEFTLERGRTFLFAHPEYQLSAVESSRYRSYVNRRANREPFHYIIEKKEFYGLEFEVTPDVLIPRAETEMLVEQTIKYLSPLSGPRFCEVGVGSGCIAISVLHSLETASAIGLEQSDKALEIALRNAKKHGVNERLELRRSDVFSAFYEEKFDLIATNPPYIPNAEMAELQAEVRDFEPHAALTDGGDGLAVIKRIVRDAGSYLVPGGHLVMEIGFGQSAAVRKMFDNAEWVGVEILSDFNGIPRMVDARIRK